MAGGNFDEVLFIFAGGIQWPQGPLTLDPNEVPRWVEAWVVQANTGAAQSFYGTNSDFPGGTRWIANTEYYRRGNFQPGPAVGTALVWAHIGPLSSGFPTHFLWTDEIQLR
jgi:hypothetical protein